MAEPLNIWKTMLTEAGLVMNGDKTETMTVCREQEGDVTVEIRGNQNKKRELKK